MLHRLINNVSPGHVALSEVIVWKTAVVVGGGTSKKIVDKEKHRNTTHWLERTLLSAYLAVPPQVISSPGE